VITLPNIIYGEDLVYLSLWAGIVSGLVLVRLLGARVATLTLTACRYDVLP
jgi:hypothetical protein